MVAPLLEIEDLHVYFDVYEGTLKVLNGVNFKVGKGERVGLLGEAGCGKTTMMKAIMRILPTPPARIPNGKILLKGKNILEMRQEDLQTVRRKHVSMIFQDPTAALNPVFRIKEQLIDVIKWSTTSAKGNELSQEEIKTQAIQILKKAALPDPERMLENYPVQLSGGMKQRVCIAMALASATDLLIADEPGTSLDVTIQDQVLRLIDGTVKKRGMAVILISHALGAVKGMVDRVYIMYAGNTVEVAKTEDIFSNPLHPYTSALFKAVPKLSGGGVPKGIRGRIPNYLNPPKGCRFFPRCDYAMSICKESKPSLLDIGDAHEVACFLVERESA